MRNAFVFTIYCLAIGVLLLVVAAIGLVAVHRSAMDLVPVLAPVLAGLTGLLVSPPKQSQ
ncbi:hypothetical protein [Microcoleus sp. F4-D5]|uniref:hypothetical protein n=1 Tax=Microcoleus sp. F4-D5 TaxID=2818760 RepID=UPI002FD784FB